MIKGRNMINALLETFGNKTRALEILYLIEGIKDAARLDANENELAKIRDFCSKNRIFLEMSGFKVIKAADEGKGGYANTVKKVPSSYPERGLYHIYLSKDGNKSKFLKIMENKNDDRAVGEMLGYPKCCVDFFIANREKQQKIQNDFILPALENSEGFEFPFYANHAMRYFDCTLLSHFPHSFSCKETIEIAKKNLETLKQYDAIMAENYENTLKCAVLYTENDGIFSLRNPHLNGNILEYGEIIPTIKNELFNELKNNKSIEIISKNKVKLNNRIIGNVGLMAFI